MEIKEIKVKKLDLLEKLEQSNLDLELIQANTDGIIVLLKNKSEFENRN